jgi:hypothetical protein
MLLSWDVLKQAVAKPCTPVKKESTCPAPETSEVSEAGQVLAGLLAYGAGVHVDFHAHRHLNNLRSLPSH